MVAKRVIVRIDYELHSPFASFQKTDQDKCGSEQVRLRVLDMTCSEPQDVAAGQFLLGRKLTLISAPAGFGKTTLVSEWVHLLL
jgi:hypothetical protein